MTHALAPFLSVEFPRLVVTARSMLLVQIIPDRSVTIPCNVQKKFPAIFSVFIRQMRDFGGLNIFDAQKRRSNVH